MQQNNQDEETEEQPAGKGTGEMPTQPKKKKEEEIGNLSEKEFQIMKVKMIQTLKSKWNHR